MMDSSSRRTPRVAALLGVCVVVASSYLSCVTAFTVSPQTTAFNTATIRKSRRSSGSSRFGMMITPDQQQHLMDVAQSALSDPTAFHQILDQSHAALVSSSHMLADAASAASASAPDAAADVAVNSAAAAAAAEKAGWWQSYLTIFKNALSLVHSTIDGPLRSIGIDQTWGISIALFTAMARTLLLPLSVQQSKNAEYMKALKPYIKDIKEKFKDNQEAQNRAVGKLYEDAEQNPLAGCLTSLAQLPIFLGLYRGVRLLAMDGELKEPFLWIPSLEGPVEPPNFRGLDWLTQGWQPAPDGSDLPVPSLGWETTLAFLVMPVILVLLQSVTMRVLQPPIDDDMSEEEKEQMERSQGFLKFLPLMIGFFSLQVPAGLTIYWFTSNIFTLSQSLGVRAYFAANPPEIELPEYWDTALSKDVDFEKMTPEERRKATEAGIRIGPSMEDLKDESRFHCLIERTPLREESEAWVRIQEGTVSASVSPELEEWVKQTSAAEEPAPTTA